MHARLAMRVILTHTRRERGAMGAILRFSVAIAGLLAVRVAALHVVLVFAGDRVTISISASVNIIR